MSLKEEERLADHLHNECCKWNHIDGCSWEYESWESPGNARNIWLKKARKILKITDSKTAIKITEIINKL